MTADEFSRLEKDDWVFTNKMPEGVHVKGFVRRIDQDKVEIEWLDGEASVMGDCDERIEKMELEAKAKGGA